MDVPLPSYAELLAEVARLRARVVELETERTCNEAVLRSASVRTTTSARVAEAYAARLESLLTYAPIGIALPPRSVSPSSIPHCAISMSTYIWPP